MTVFYFFKYGETGIYHIKRLNHRKELFPGRLYKKHDSIKKPPLGGRAK